MTINSSQIYNIEKLKRRKISVIMAGIQRTFCETSITRKVVFGRLNKDLHMTFGTDKIKKLDESQYDQCVKLISDYKFYYIETYFG